MFQLTMVILALAMEVNSDGRMMATSRVKGDPYKIAKQNGWTFQTGNGTAKARRAALVDCVAVKLANDTTWEIPSTVTNALSDGEIARAHGLAVEIMNGVHA